MTSRAEVERLIGAVLVPEVRVAGTVASSTEIAPSRAYLARFPPSAVVVFGRKPSGAGAPGELLARVRAMCVELGHAAPLACCDLEQGAGLHFDTATRLPPALALASAALANPGREVLDWIAAAGELTALEARANGIELVLAPVGDVNTRCDNPIIAVRAFGDEAFAAGQRASAFAIGLHAGGAAGCAKHFPGHGDTGLDSHVALPSIDRERASLEQVELVPFRRLIAHGIECVMIGHLDVPALTAEPGLPCTLSKRAVEGCLRGELGFDGVVLTDAMNMGALGRHEPRYVRALEAGCDGLLCPHDPDDAAEQLLAATLEGRLTLERLEQAARRMSSLRERLAALPVRAGRAQELQRGMAHSLATRALRLSVDGWPWPAGCAIAVADPVAPIETPEVAACVERLRSQLGGQHDAARTLLPVICEARAGRGRYGLNAQELERLEARLQLVTAQPNATPLVIAWFGSPQSVPARLWSDPRAVIVLAFAPTPPMFAAVAELCVRAVAPQRGSLAARLG